MRLDELLKDDALMLQFWNSAHWEGECLVHDADGYGSFMHQARHVVACASAHGPRPDGMLALHSCDNPRCCRPAHLRWSTKSENMKDCARAKPDAWRTNGKAPALTAGEVLEVMGLLEDGWQQNHIALLFGVSKDVINHIARGKYGHRGKGNE